jgi:hypothetical protein
MRTNTDVTIYNRYVVSGEEVYQRTQVLGVAWQGSKGRSGPGSSNQEANQVVIYIPSQNNTEYLPAKAWQALTDKSDNWTLQNNDVIVKGLVSDEIIPADQTGGPFSVSDLKAKYDHVLVISDVQTRDDGSPSMNHWQVTAK